MKNAFKILLHCYNFPDKDFEIYTNIFVGVQKKEEVVMDTSIDVETKNFIIPVKVKPNKAGAPNFLGEFVHGKVGDRFLYLVWYQKKGIHKERFRRAKIKLAPISWTHIENAIHQNQPIQANINLTDHKGGPVCATLKSTNLEWRLQDDKIMQDLRN